jgi:spore germination protein
MLRPGSRRTSSLLTAALGCALALTASSAATGTAATDPGRERLAAPLSVTGYVLESAGPRLVRRNAAGLDQLGVAAVLLHGNGKSVAEPSGGAVRLLRAAHANNLRAELLLSNYSNRLEDFDPEAASRLLRSDNNIRRVARRLAGFADDQGWDGITVDLERLRPQDSAGLVMLIDELQVEMDAERTVSVDVSASSSLRAFRHRGYRLARLADVADVVALMTYDLHGPTWSGPGPIGSLPWQERVLRIVLEKVPAEQIDVGVSGYGYTWPRHGTGRTVTVARARRMVERDGARAVWKPKPGEWTAKLSNGTVLWWSDARSYEKRRQLAGAHAVHGLALWRLGSADTLGPTPEGGRAPSLVE